MTPAGSTLTFAIWLAIGSAACQAATVPDASQFAAESAVSTVHCSGERFYRFWPLASWQQLGLQTRTVGAPADLKQKARELGQLQTAQVCALEKRPSEVEKTYIPGVGVVVDQVFWVGTRGTAPLDKARSRLKPGQPAIQAYVEALNTLLGGATAAANATAACVTAADTATALDGQIKALREEMLAYHHRHDASTFASGAWSVDLELFLRARYPELKDRFAELARLSARKYELSRLPKDKCVETAAAANPPAAPATPPAFGGGKAAAAQPLAGVGASLGMKAASETVPTQRRSAESGLAAADRAATALGYPDDPEASDTRIELMVDAALGGFDNLAEAQQELLAETARTQEAGDGSHLRIQRVVAPEDRQHLPGDTIEIRVTVANDATKGNAAYATLGLWDYGTEKDVDKRLLHIAPGGRDTQVFRWRVPGDYHRQLEAYLAPVNADQDPPGVRMNFKIVWDGSTMTDAEILADLRERVPDTRYEFDRHDHADLLRVYRDQGRNEAILRLNEQVSAWARDLEQRQYLEYVTDPDYLARQAEDAAARENSRLLAQFDKLVEWAVEQGKKHELDLLGVLEDYVYVDDRARLHGSLSAARHALNDKIAEKLARTSAVERYLLYYDDDSCYQKDYQGMHSTAETYVAPVVAGLSGSEEAIKDLKDLPLRQLKSQFEALVEAYNRLDTNPDAIVAEIAGLERRIAFVRNRLANFQASTGGVAYGHHVDVLDAYLDRMERMRSVVKKAEQQAAAEIALTAKSEARSVSFKRFSTGLKTMSSVLEVYDTGRKIYKLQAMGEPPGWAVSRAATSSAVRMMVTENPLGGAVDGIMTVSGHVIYHWEKEFFDANPEYDTRMMNPSTLLDIGINLGMASVQDRVTHWQKVWDRQGTQPTQADLDEIRARIKTIEQRMNETKDPELLARLSQTRRYLRENYWQRDWRD